MIRVTCDACGASFTAKDELAGRKGKCPSCKAPIEVPQPEADDEPEEHEEAPVVVAHGGRRHGSGRRASGSSRRRHNVPHKKSNSQLVVILVAVVVLGGAGAWWGSQAGDGPSGYSIGLDLMQQSRWEEAIASFDSVPPDSRLYADAQAMRKQAQDEMAAGDRRASMARANNLYEIIKRVQKSFVDRDGQGHFDPNYVPNTRYLLKRCKEFREDFPDDKHVSEIRQIEQRYKNIASLSEPPTEADVRAELNFRMILANPNYIDSMKAIDEFALAWPDKVEAAQELRNEVRSHSLEYWKAVKGEVAPMLEGGRLEAAANKLATYLEKMDETPGLDPVAEAREMYAKALGG